MADCGVPPFIGNGNFNVTETTFESVAEYGCNEGFTLSGSLNRTCQADGTWSGAAPVCVVPPNLNVSSRVDNLGPIISGTVAGVLVVALVTLGIILATILTRRRRMTAANFNLELQSKVSNKARDQAALSHFQYTELDIRNAAYVTNADAIPVSRNEAYTITKAVAITTSQSHDYDYVFNPIIQETSDMYDYIDS